MAERYRLHASPFVLPAAERTTNHGITNIRIGLRWTALWMNWRAGWWWKIGARQVS